MKKKLPLDLIKGFHPKFGDSVTFEKGDSNQRIVIFKDKDPDSDFFFEIKSINPNSDKILVEFKPTNGAILKPLSVWLTIQELNSKFTSWVKMIDDYNSSETIFDDPIIKGFEEEFWKDVEFVDAEDAAKPLPVDIILRLDAHLEKIETRIETFKDESNQNEISKIKDSSIQLRAELATKPKKYVLTKLINIWAKLAKQGPKVIKEFLTEGGKMVVKETIKFLIGKGFELLN